MAAAALSLASAGVAYAQTSLRRPVSRGEMLKPCSTFKWSPPRTLETTDHRFVYVEAPVVIATKSGLTLLGTPVFEWETRTRVVDDSKGTSSPKRRLKKIGAVLDQRMRVVGFVEPPAGHSQMIAVQAVALDEGRAAVFWGEVPGAEPVLGMPVTEVWYAVLDGVSWGTPERVLAANQIKWNRESASITFRHGILAVAFPANTTHGTTDISGVAISVKYPSSEWRTSWSGVHTLSPHYVTLVLPRPSTAVLSFIGAYSSTGGSSIVNGLYVVRSDDSSNTWSIPEILQPFEGERTGQLPKLIGQGPLTLRLVWAGRKVDEVVMRTIEGLVSQDDGASWTPLSPYTIAGQANRLEFSDIGQNFALWTTMSGGALMGKLVLAQYTQTGWSDVRFPFNVTAASAPTLQRTGKESVILTWGEARNVVGAGGFITADPVMMYSVSRHACSPLTAK